MAATEAGVNLSVVENAGIETFTIDLISGVTIDIS